MRAAAVVALALLSGGTGAVVASLLHEDGAPDDGLATTTARIGQQLAAAEAAADHAARRLDALERGGLAPVAGAAFTQEQIEAAVDAVLARRAAAGLSGGDENAGSAPDAGEAALTADEVFARLADPALDEMARNLLWQQARDAGLTDALVAKFEALAEADPQDPDLQVARGVAYLQKIQEVGNGPLAGVWANKADQAFDAALAVDPGNWDARFTKAVALSFWPPIFGKQAEAIAQFETLRERQSGLAPQASHAQTYLLLGNLYQQTGRQDRALEVWVEGLELFPDNADLRARFQTGQ